jgi:hypothetical protein
MLAKPEIMAPLAFLRASASALDWRAHSELGAIAIERKRDCRLSWSATEFTWTWVEGGGSIDDTSIDGIDVLFLVTMTIEAHNRPDVRREA